MKNKCPICQSKQSFFTAENTTCKNCGTDLTSKNKSIAYYAVCIVAYFPIKFALSASWNMGTLFQAIMFFLGVWVLFIILNLVLVDYEAAESKENK